MIKIAKFQMYMIYSLLFEYAKSEFHATTPLKVKSYIVNIVF